MAVISYDNLSERLEKSLEKISLLTQDKHKDLRIEQIEFDKNDQIKSCVVSYLIKREDTDSMAKLSIIIPPYERVYKEFKFDHEGKIIGLFIFNDI